MRSDRVRIWGTCLVLLAGIAGAVRDAQAQSLTIDDGSGKRVPLHVDRVKAEISLLGNVAETTVTLRFQNHTDRMQEGEFVMPLPPGATVSSYALEVNGALRESVSVEKERARLAYETIKRRMIDPGLVERQAGNVYRTRVFPVPPNGTKELRIGFVEHLRPDGINSFRYRLPLKFPQPVDEFSCKVSHRGEGELTIAAPDAISFKDDGAARSSSSAKDVVLDGDLKLRWRKRPGSEVFAEKDQSGTTWVYASGIFPDDVVPAQRPAPRTIRLLWDASDSAGGIDRKKIFALLDRYFRELGDVRVELSLLRYEPASGGLFEVADGDWKVLRERLVSVVYDGATNYAKLMEQVGESSITILVTDGRAPRSAWNFRKAGGRLFIINGGETRIPNAASLLANESGGAAIELEADESEANALTQLTMHPRTVTIRGIGLRDPEIEFNGDAGSPFRVFGKLSYLNDDEVTIRYASGGNVRDEILTTLVDERPRGSILRRLWAQRRLARMESSPQYSRNDIISFARQHRLVSDHTSLIVLERLQDYVTYRIPPPEPDIRRQYEEAIAEKRPEAWEAWSDKLRWYERVFPWADVALWEPLKRVTIWKNATDRIFAVNERDSASYDRIARWHDAALAVIDRRPDLRTQDDLTEWMAEVGELTEHSAAFSRVDTELPPVGGATSVSVQGLVKNPGKVKSDRPPTLREAVTRAGGTDLLGSLSQVTLYRQAARITLNLLSKEYKPLSLRPGDMIVVKQRWEQPGGDFLGGADPFGEDPFGDSPEPVPPSEMPAVVPEEEQDFGGEFGEPRDDRAMGNFRFSGDGGGHDVLQRKMTSVARAVAHAEKPFPQADAFRKALDDGVDPLRAYVSAKGTKGRAVRFYVQSARILFDHGHASLARQVLSNLVEYHEDPAAARAFAFWLMEFDQWDAAHDASLLLLNHDNITVSEAAMLDAARASERAGDIGAAGEQYERLLRSFASDGIDQLECIALTERNSLVARMTAESGLKRRAGEDPSLWKNLSSDVRIVMTSDTGRVSLQITDPLGDTITYWNHTSRCGGRLSESGHHQEFMMRRGLPGTYKVACRNRGRAVDRGSSPTVQIGLFTNWGREDQSVRWLTVLLENEAAEVGQLEFVFGEGG